MGGEWRLEGVNRYKKEKRVLGGEEKGRVCLGRRGRRGGTRGRRVLREREQLVRQRMTDKKDEDKNEVN